MMNFLTPPTDSLYKFIAIMGMISMMGGIVLLVTSHDKKSELIMEYEGKELVLQKEISFITEELQFNNKYKNLNDSVSAFLTNKLGSNYDSKNLGDTISKLVFYNLPDTIKNRLKELAIKKQELESNRVFLEYYKNSNDDLKIPYGILLYGGEILALIGLVLWYEMVQKPASIAEKNKLLIEQNKIQSEDTWQSDCQSCYKKIYFLNERGSEQDGSISRAYCKKCFSEGKFVEEELQLDQALERLRNELKNRKYSKLSIFRYSKALKNCIRWKSQTHW